LPVPSCPEPFWPQQRTVPSLRSAHACCAPFCTSATVTQPPASLGTQKSGGPASPGPSIATSASSGASLGDVSIVASAGSVASAMTVASMPASSSGRTGGAPPSRSTLSLQPAPVQAAGSSASSTHAPCTQVLSAAHSTPSQT